MLGIATFAGLAFGLGLLCPLRAKSGDYLIGLRFTLGVSLLILILCFLAVALNLTFRLTALVLAGLALAGWLLGLLRLTREASVAGLLHPAFLLPVLAMGAIAAYGGIGYSPYLGDEFTNWIGVSRIIHWAGSYDAVRQSIQLPSYTPGWRLLLILPWQITGDIDLGLSAAAPLVLHVAVLALVYDIAVLVLCRDGGLSISAARFCGWAFLLLLMGAEGMGRLWTSELLIEQPQIYLLSAAMLLLLMSDLFVEKRIVLYAATGVVLAAGYLLKAAGLAAAPAALLVALMPLANQMASKRKAGLSRRIQDFALAAFILLGPLLIVSFLWSEFAPVDDCMGSPIKALLQGNISAAYDPVDLARRFSAAVVDYAAGYKSVVGVVAAIGVTAALWFGFYRAPLFWFVFAGAYFMALYGYHLTCFGDYYYQELNSIPRFTRVPLQAFHTLGLFSLLVAAVRLSSELDFSALRGVIARPTVLACLVIAVTGLASWQAWRTYRAVMDLTTRVDQTVDPRIAQMEKAANFSAAYFGSSSPRPPLLAVLDQGDDGDVMAYARYFALRKAEGGMRMEFYPYHRSSWAAVPQNIWQTESTEQELTRELGAMDVLWPVHVDSWLLSALAGLIPDNDCLASLPQFALLRDDRSDTPVFRCVAKGP